MCMCVHMCVWFCERTLTDTVCLSAVGRHSSRPLRKERGEHGLNGHLKGQSTAHIKWPPFWWSILASHWHSTLMLGYCQGNIARVVSFLWHCHDNIGGVILSAQYWKDDIIRVILPQPYRWVDIVAVILHENYALSRLVMATCWGVKMVRVLGTIRLGCVRWLQCHALTRGPCVCLRLLSRAHVACMLRKLL